MKNYGKKIAYYRKLKGLSQSQLASKLNFTRQTISRWEQGSTEPDIDNVVKLCEIFEVSPDEFLLGGEVENSEKEEVKENDLITDTGNDIVIKDEVVEEEKKKYLSIKKPKGIFSKPLWITMTSVFIVLLIGTIIGSQYAFAYKKTINTFFNLPMTNIVKDPDAESHDTEYFKSKYTKVDSLGNTVYDPVALKEKTKEVALQEQKEGTTILWNENNALPIGKKNVSLFGLGAFAYAYSGHGSGSAEGGGLTMFEALKQAGINVNETLWNAMKAQTDYYKYEDVTNGKIVVKNSSEIPWDKMNTSQVQSSYANYNDTAIYVITRRSGEVGWGNDLLTKNAGTIDGDYFSLFEREKTVLKELTNLRKNGTFKNLVVLLNTAEGIGFNHFMEYKDDIDACMWIGQGGKFGIEEVGNILAGTSIPSGHLVDTFVMSGLSAPASVNHEFDTYKNNSGKDWGSEKGDWSGAGRGYFMSHYTIYAENIYVGYKYYETRYEDYVLGNGNANGTAGAICSNGGWKYESEVAFPFGYGLSYTNFEYSNPIFKENSDGSYEVKVTIKNVGNEKGQDAVQVYIQRPYTDYDKQNQIEQASVNLCGFAKTGVIDPDKSEVVTINISADAFKTYDANNKKTYIREAGDYYLAIGEDSHAAINNILAQKGKKVSDGMTSEGNASLVKKITFNDNDYKTFSKSSTGETITNKFDDCDWNKYENKDSTDITYLSRSDWNATYPKKVQLTVNAKMWDDLDYNKTYEANPKDKMPKYGEQNGLSLVAMRGKDYDDPAWDLLLDQTTLDEQIELLGKSAYGTPAIPSIGKPGEKVGDGPLGIYRAFTSTVLLAASYNESLSEEVGDLMGEYALQNKRGGIYAPGANLHRSIYGGRGFEYYSEDTYVSSRMLATQVRGIQSTGTYVNVKHFVLNDQDSARKGISTWTNEQALREVYLEVFRAAVEQENCMGVMTGFNRIGTTWCGALSSLNNGVLRDEWGFKGFVISDCPWQEYMGTVDGLFGGNDCILYEKVDLTQYYKAKTNATIALKIRESTKRILYVVVNTNAMNGLDTSTKIIPITSWWWSRAIIGLLIGFSIISATSIAMLTITLIKRKKYKEACAAENITIKEYEEYYKNNLYEKPKPVKFFKWFIPKKLFITLTSIFLVIVVSGVTFLTVLTVKEIKSRNHKCEDICLVCGKCTTDCEERNCSDKCPGNHTIADIGGNSFTFEAEDAVLKEITDDGNKKAQVGKENIDPTEPSGGAYIYKLSQANAGTTVTFDIKSEKTSAVGLIMRMGHNGRDVTLDELFKIQINGKMYQPNNKVIFTAYDENTEVKYFAWKDTEIGIITLKEGFNKIIFSKTSTGLNFDAIKLVSKYNLEWAKESCSDHKYPDYELDVAPTTSSEGSLIRYCTICGTEDRRVLPKLSEENGYTKKVIKEASITEEGQIEWTIKVNEQEFKFVSAIAKLPDIRPKNTYIFEAEDSEIYSVNGKVTIGTSETASGGKYIDKMSDDANGSSLTFNIYAEDSCSVDITISSIKHYRDKRAFDDYYTTSINGSIVKTNYVIEPNTNEDEKATIWTTFYDFKVLENIQLEKGNNTITFTKCGLALNLDAIKIDSAVKLSWSSEINQKTLKIEAEDVTLGGTAKATTEEGMNNPSGGKFVGGLSAMKGTLTFVVNAESDCVAKFVMCYGNRTNDTSDRKFSSKFTLTVNDVAMSSSTIFNNGTENNYFGWEEYEICKMNLKAGDNVIVLSSTGVTSSNIDYFKLLSDKVLTFKA